MRVYCLNIGIKSRFTPSFHGFAPNRHKLYIDTALLSIQLVSVHPAEKL